MTYRFLTDADIRDAQQRRAGYKPMVMEGEGTVRCGQCAHALDHKPVQQIAWCGERRFQVNTTQPALCDRFVDGR